MSSLQRSNRKACEFPELEMRKICCVVIRANGRVRSLHPQIELRRNRNRRPSCSLARVGVQLQDPFRFDGLVYPTNSSVSSAARRSRAPRRCGMVLCLLPYEIHEFEGFGGADFVFCFSFFFSAKLGRKRNVHSAAEKTDFKFHS